MVVDAMKGAVGVAWAGCYQTSDLGSSWRYYTGSGTSAWGGISPSAPAAGKYHLTLVLLNTNMGYGTYSVSVNGQNKGTFQKSSICNIVTHESVLAKGAQFSIATSDYPLYYLAASICRIE